MGATVSNGVTEAAGPQGLTTYGAVDDQILGAMWNPGGFYWLCLAIAGLGVLIGAFSWGYQIATGLGAANITHPTMWGSYLVNFVFWVGIAHSGTLISAILFLFRASWRTTISRSSEAMTIFAVMIAGMFPLIHLGRVWLVYWILPYPNQRNLWPNFQSPLVFDVVAVSTYLTVSFLFWYTGMIPDLATIRDRTIGLKNRIYGFFSLGWRGSNTSWKITGPPICCLPPLPPRSLFPSIASFPGTLPWASFRDGTALYFAPYFVAGAIHSGLAMVLVLLIPMRKIFGFENLITIEVLENIGKDDNPYRPHRRLFIYGRTFHGLVRRRQGRRGPVHVADDRLLFLVLLADGRLQRLRSDSSLFQKIRTDIPALFSVGILVLHRDVVRAAGDYRRVGSP